MYVRSRKLEVSHRSCLKNGNQKFCMEVENRRFPMRKVEKLNIRPGSKIYVRNQQNKVFVWGPWHWTSDSYIMQPYNVLKKKGKCGRIVRNFCPRSGYLFDLDTFFAQIVAGCIAASLAQEHNRRSIENGSLDACAGFAQSGSCMWRVRIAGRCSRSRKGGENARVLCSQESMENR